MAQNIMTEERAVSFKGPILKPFMDLYFFFLSWTPMEQPHIVKYTKKQ